MSRCIGSISIGVIFILSVSLAFGTDKAGDQPRVEVALGDQSAVGSLLLLDLGNRKNRETVEIKLLVRNKQQSAVSLDAFKFGDTIDARWSEPDPAIGVETRANLPAEGSAELRLKIRTDSELSSENIGVLLAVNGQQEIFIGIRYRVLVPTRSVNIGGEYYSGRGEEYGKYWLCTGPAPFGYHLVTAFIDAHTIQGHHERNCNSHMHCIADQKDDNDVCYRFEIQGHYQGGSLAYADPQYEDQIVSVILRAVYAVNDPVVQLLSYNPQKVQKNLDGTTPSRK